MQHPAAPHFVSSKSARRATWFCVIGAILLALWVSIVLIRTQNDHTAARAAAELVLSQERARTARMEHLERLLSDESFAPASPASAGRRPIPLITPEVQRPTFLQHKITV